MQKRVLILGSDSDANTMLANLHLYAQSINGSTFTFGNCIFTVINSGVFDAVLVFNNVSQMVTVNTYSNSIYVFMLEPGLPHHHPYMYHNLQQYAKVYSPVAVSDNTVISHGYLGWYISKSYHQLTALLPPNKPQQVSLIASGKNEFVGHRNRLHFVRQLTQTNLPINYFGFDAYKLPRLINKEDALLPYKYSIAIENTSMPHYFTEKLMDCFLCYTVPFYYGCTNINTYFDSNAYIWIDITKPTEAIQIIKQTLSDVNDYERRLPAIIDARNKVLNQYQPLSGINNLIDNNNNKAGLLKPITLKPVAHSTYGLICIKLNKLWVQWWYK